MDRPGTNNLAVPDGQGLVLCFLFLLCVWSSVVSVFLGRLDWWEAVPGASPWRLWGPGVLAWSWPLVVVATFFLSVVTLRALYILTLAPVALLAATALTVVEFRRRRAEDLAAGTPRRVKD
jgi:hypothetical protein